MNYIGMDPGKNGGIVCLWESGTISSFTIPLINDDLNVRQLCEYFKIFDSAKLNGEQFKVILEDVHSIHGASAKSNFVFGKVNGVLQTLIEVYSLPFVKVNPKTWQKLAFQGIAFNEDKKEMAAQAVHRLFPNTSFIIGPRTKKPHDGLVDACLMAYYGKVNNL